ncbi:hypothetical protein [Deinococcus ruber]|uniref:Uncharacterized protein n=1 Tax=Deinococcus ruber TaxID=1848197 RepID=A0A918CN49_9DEIO|nr:hypothetical protein [Deinococcus ruber]GGR33019.1 hypothetical protein GCM10008957_49250 [Deinococcus ruber]
MAQQLAQLLALQDAQYHEFQQLLEQLEEHPSLERVLEGGAAILERAQEIRASNQRLQALYTSLLPLISRNITTLQQQEVLLRRLLARLTPHLPDGADLLNHDWN